MLVILPFWPSFLVRMYAWVFLLRSEGTMNLLLAQVGLGPLELLYRDAAVLLGQVYGELPYLAWLRPDDDEAARACEANGLRPDGRPSLMAASLAAIDPPRGTAEADGPIVRTDEPATPARETTSRSDSASTP